MGSLHFSVSGEWVTNFAREKFLETGNIRDGVNFLKDTLRNEVVGFPDDLAEDIVRGKKKLVGVNELTVEADDKNIEPYCWIKPTDIKNCECGWIAPNGDVFGMPKHTMTTEHVSLADELIFRGAAPDTEITSERSIEKAGFIKFQPRLVVGSCDASMITEAQKSKVLEFMESHNIGSIQIGFSLDKFVQIASIRKCELLQFGILVTS